MEQQVKYSDTEINAYILKAVREMGFEYMTPIQEQAIPVLLEGKDVISKPKNELLPFHLEETKDEINKTYDQYTRTIDFRRTYQWS